jgi:uncharacterized membrane protein YjjP (DUF1212 family)
MTSMPSVERALDVALIVMRNGGTTRMADRTFRNVLKGYKHDGVTVTWRLDFAAASAVVEGQSSTIFRPVGPIGINLTRASEAAVLGERVARGKVDTAAIASEVERINTLAPSYRRWAMIAAAAGSAAMFTRITGGDWGALGIAFVAAGVGQLLRSWLQAKKLPVAPVTFISGTLSACIAGAGLRLGLSGTVPAVAVASVIYMVPGLPLINGFVDVVAHKYLSVGLERIAHAAYLFLILAIAVALANAVVM